ncbi:unnamed protein product [Phytophthora fragariaefolia]|uniref:Unnamed protein product n=1 Tax=Phytophthora fragariaefolia TaxID=1490495 RepID=A0A9W6Y0K8_9STRA|nr:unnamed protein product [Phytophthora fragariaefolia]
MTPPRPLRHSPPSSSMAPATQHVDVAPVPLDAESPEPLPAVPQDFPVLCQICLDAPASVFQLCGAQCLAELCELCLVQHVAASVYTFYPGVLPKVRCPVCLTLLNKNQWQRFVLPVASEQAQEQQETEQLADDSSHVLDKYVMLCRQSCGFQSPCCHNAEYTMLPERYADSDDEGDDEEDVARLELLLEQVEALPELHRRGVEFCYHREEVESFYAFLATTFGARVERVLWRLLPKIVDEERRAALLLRHLGTHPDAHTRCCGAKVCFKCKATDHHDGACRDFIEDESVVESMAQPLPRIAAEGDEPESDAARAALGSTRAGPPPAFAARAAASLAAAGQGASTRVGGWDEAQVDGRQPDARGRAALAQPVGAVSPDAQR